MGKDSGPTTLSLTEMICSKDYRQKGIALLHANHKRSIFQYVMHKGGTMEHAEEIAVSALVLAVEAVDTGRFAGKSQLSTFYIAIGKNLWRNEVRKDKRMVESASESLEITPEIKDSVQVVMEKQELKNRLKKCLSSLGARCEQIIRLWKLSEPSPSWPEIASELGFSSVQVAKNKGQRCMKSLKNCMGKAA